MNKTRADPLSVPESLLAASMRNVPHRGALPLTPDIFPPIPQSRPKKIRKKSALPTPDIASSILAASMRNVPHRGVPPFTVASYMSRQQHPSGNLPGKPMVPSSRFDTVDTSTANSVSIEESHGRGRVAANSFSKGIVFLIAAALFIYLVYRKYRRHRVERQKRRELSILKNERRAGRQELKTRKSKSRKQRK